MEAVVAGIVPYELGSAVVNSCGDLKTEGLWWWWGRLEDIKEGLQSQSSPLQAAKNKENV